MDFSRIGKPAGKDMIEGVNVNWFLSLDVDRARIESWRRGYNYSQPHSSLGDLTL
ncbi:MAG: transposase [Deltaproteobacteria bacterium]|nr:transposase [Deltaproteobacteria bacterium]